MIPNSRFSNSSICRQVLLASEIMVCLGILLSFHILIPYSVPQYVGSALLTFVAAEVLEGNKRLGSISMYNESLTNCLKS